MSNYTKSTNFATKDNLPTGDPLKIVKGTEIDTEFNNIATAIATKTDNSAAAITGGSITGITDLAVADGGTGASTAAGALNNLLPSQTSNANKYLQTDGTNATWDAVSLSTSDITGTLPIANGGTGTTSTTFANLTTNVTGTLPVANGGTGVTSSTGTGNVVLSNSPTLVTPALGTPASGVATNLTGLPLSTGITGLGTGVATALAINTPNTGAMVVNGGALGTPSSGTVTNLTGTASININGQVGSSTPNSGNFTTLSASSTVTISGGTADGVAYLNGSKVLTTGSVLSFSGVHLTSNRNKDTTYSGTDYTTYPNGFILQNSATPATGLFNSIYFKNNANMQNVFGVVQNSSGYGDFVWAGFSGSYAEWMRLSSSGLTLTSNPTLSGGTANGVTYLNGSKVLTSGSVLVFDGTTLSNLGSGDRAKFGNGTRNIYIAGDTNGVSLLDGASQTGNGWYMNGASNFVAGYVGSAETLRLTSTSLYTASGINVGIGTSSPASKLDIRATNPTVTVKATSTGYPYAFFSNDGGDFYIGRDSSAGAAFNNANANVIWGVGANPILFATNNTVKATLDSAGNLGLGVTPSAWNTSYAKAMQLPGGSLWSYQDSVIAMQQNSYYNNAGGFVYIANGFATEYYQYQGAHIWRTAPSGTAGNPVSFTDAMTLDANGTLIVGSTSALATSASTRGQVSANGSSDAVFVLGVGGTATSRIYTSASSTTVGTYTNTPLILDTNSTERARIDSSGNLLVGTTSVDGIGWTIYPTGYAVTKKSGTAATTHMSFQNDNGQVGYIQTSGSLTIFGTTSDYRLKTVIGAVAGHGERLDALEPIEYTWNVNGSRTRGFLAHKFQEVYADSVTGTKDAVDENGNPVYQGMQAATSEVIADLVAEIQSLRQRLSAANL